MSSISASRHAFLSYRPDQSFTDTPVAAPASDPVIRTRRETSANASDLTPPQWTLRPSPSPSADADNELQASLSASALGQVSDSLVKIPSNATIYAGFDALRSAFNTPEVQAWVLKKGLALDTVVVTPDSISGWVMGRGAPKRKTFHLGDHSGWWQVGARLRAAARSMDVEGKGLAYVPLDSERFSRNAILKGYGITPPSDQSELSLVRQALSRTNWSALPSETKAQLESRNLSARKAIDTLDERAHLLAGLGAVVLNKPDEDALQLSGVQTPISHTSVLATGGAAQAAIVEVLKSHGLPVPKTAMEARNVMRWLDAALPTAPALGNYVQLLSDKWKPGVLSGPDRQFVAQLSDDESDDGKTGFNLLRVLDIDAVLKQNSASRLRDRADHFLEQILNSPVALTWGETIARNLDFRGASGSTQPSTLEAKQWLLAAIVLQIDPEAKGVPGTVAGYDIYQPSNNGRTLAAVRAQIETHLWKKTSLDANVAPLLAHLFLASAAPEFLVRDIPSTLRVGSAEWADLRLGVAFAERQGGAGSSRGMNYQEIMALARLDGRTPEEAAVLDNHGVDVLLDWGLMQGIYAKAADGRYTPQQYQQATEAFEAERGQLLQALKIFKKPLPTRRSLAIANLQKAFPDLSGPQLQALKVQIADPDERRNMKPSEPKTRSLIETYMTGDLVKDRWMLVSAEAPAAVQSRRTPYSSNSASRAEQAVIVQKVRALNAKIEALPNVQAQVVSEVDTYLANLKHGLGATTKRMIADLPLADRQALEYGAVELFSLREDIDGVPTLDQTAALLEERRGRKGTLIRCTHNGVISYFEVFPAKMLIVKREDLPDQLTIGGKVVETVKTYGRYAPTPVQLQRGAQESFDFTAYNSDALPRAGVMSGGIIIDKLGDTLPAASETAAGNVQDAVPNSFASSRTQTIVDRIMQGNFVHHRDTVLKAAQAVLPLEQQREVSQRNDRILLSMIPFVGSIVELAKGNIIEGTRGLLIDTVGAFLGGAGSAVRSLAKSTKAVAPFGAKAFRMVEKGVAVVSAFINPADGAADLLVNSAKGVLALPRLMNSAPRVSALANMLVAQEKLRAFFGLQVAIDQVTATQSKFPQAAEPNGHNHGVPVRAIQSGEHWYACNPFNGSPSGTPLDGYTPLSRAHA